MRPRFRLLILGGTAEARALAAALAGRPGLEVVTSLAGRTRRPARPAGGLRVGGFGGVDGLARWLADHAVDAVIDATHPFAAAISANAGAACERLGVPRLALVRPPWRPVVGDRWTVVADVEAAAGRVAALGERPLLAVGRQSLKPFAGRLRGCAVVRVFEPPAETALPGARVVVDRGPFSEAGETALLRREGVDLVVSKNAGGRAGYAKIAAARALGLPVLMIDRPPPPGPPHAADAAAAAAWLDAGRLSEKFGEVRVDEAG